jgi:NadR type nicotinamide-nucleotide adenylyltransferase
MSDFPDEPTIHAEASKSGHRVKRVVVCGPESTGKTTLCRQLAEHFGTVWVPEYVRGYLDRKQAPCEASDLPLIARGQIASEDELARQARGVLFCDTDLTMTVVYARLYYGACPEWIERIAAAREYDLHLLTAVDVAWVPDPQRDMPHRRQEIFERCRAALEGGGRRYMVVRGTWDERFRTAREAVVELMQMESG